MDISCAITILVHCDNCKSQNKSAKYFHHLQMLANQNEKQVLRVWSNTGHGKGEVDRVGGVAKMSITRALLSDYFFNKNSEIISYLPDKFAGKVYKFVETDSQALAESRAEKPFNVMKLLLDQVTFLSPESETFRASPHLCLCDLCVLNYG